MASLFFKIVKVLLCHKEYGQEDVILRTQCVTLSTL
jgi:hypothetical protein